TSVRVVRRRIDLKRPRDPLQRFHVLEAVLHDGVHGPTVAVQGSAEPHFGLNLRLAVAAHVIGDLAQRVVAYAQLVSRQQDRVDELLAAESVQAVPREAESNRFAPASMLDVAEKLVTLVERCRLTSAVLPHSK